MKSLDDAIRKADDDMSAGASRIDSMTQRLGPHRRDVERLVRTAVRLSKCLHDIQEHPAYKSGGPQADSALYALDVAIVPFADVPEEEDAK